MSDWTSYSLSDFLMFSPEAYFRLFELNNTALWPFQPAIIFAAAVLPFMSLKEDKQSGQIVSIILAMLWGLVAWQFFYQLYAKINLAAPSFAIAFSIESLALLFLVFTSNARHSKPGLTLFMYALIIHPFIGILSGRDWQAVELFGIAPDPTALGTLGLLMMRTGIMPKILALIPVTWCLASGLTYLAMELPYGLTTPAAALFFIAIAMLSNIRKSRISSRKYQTIR